MISAACRKASTALEAIEAEARAVETRIADLTSQLEAAKAATTEARKAAREAGSAAVLGECSAADAARARQAAAEINVRAEDIESAIEALIASGAAIRERRRSARSQWRAIAAEAKNGPASECRDRIAVHAQALAKEMVLFARLSGVGDSLLRGERYRQACDVAAILREHGVVIEGSEIRHVLVDGRDDMSIDEFLAMLADSAERLAAE